MSLSAADINAADAKLPHFSGVVLNANDGTPLSGAFVVVQPGPQSAGQFEPAGTETGPDGRFAVGAAPKGEFEIIVQKPGFLQFARKFGAPETGGAANPAKDTPDLEVPMVPEAVISGRVTGPLNQPLEGATVRLSRVLSEGGRTVMLPVSQTTTNDIGEYRLFDLPPGRYYVGAFYFDQGSRLGLHRHESNGNGGTEDYALTYFPSSLRPEDAATVRARPGQVTSGIDIRLSMVSSFDVSGMVRDLPDGVVLPQVYLQPLQLGGLGPIRYTTPAASGTFRFRSVPPGSYLLRAEARSAGQVLSAREPVTVNGADVDRIDLDLKPPFSVAGTMSTATGESPPTGLQVRLTAVEGRFSAPLKPRSDGTFELQVPGPDLYAVDWTSTNGAAFVKSLTLDSTPVNPLSVQILGPGHTIGIVVSDTAGQVEGQAVDSSQRGVTSGRRLGRFPCLLRGARIRRDFKIKSVPPGTYRLSCFSDLTTGSDATWDVLGKVRESGEQVTVEERQTVHLTVNARQAD